MSEHKPAKLDNEFGRPLQAEHYLKYRPTYPDGFLHDLLDEPIRKMKAHSKDGKLTAIDLACGSGQLTSKLLHHFDRVIAVDFCEPQLVNAAKAFPEEIAAKKVIFMKFDCSKIDELLALEEVKALDPRFVFIGEAFHWFHYDDLLSRFKRATEHRPMYFVPISYWTFKLQDATPAHEAAITKFVETVNPYFKFNLASLTDEYREFDFTKYFDRVVFQRVYQPVNRLPTKYFLGYLSTWSAYRNLLEKNGEAPDSDPLLALEKQLGLSGGKDFENLQVETGGCETLTYKNRFFAYVLI